MINRVTSHMMGQNALRNLQGGLSDLSALQTKASSQKAFLAPSEDPAAFATTVKLHAAQQANTQFDRNVNDGLAWVTTADNAISSSVDLIGRARDLTIQGSNTGAMDALSREAIAVELVGIREELMGQANTKYLGRSVFAGTASGQAFNSATYAHNGIGGGEVNRRIGENQTIRVDADGAAVFGEGADSVFALIDSIVNDLRGGGANASTHIAALDDRRTAMLGAQGKTGVAQAALERAKSSILTDKVELESRRSATEDIDSAEVILALQSKQVVYDMSLSITAKSLPTNLMEYLR